VNVELTEQDLERIAEAVAKRLRAEAPKERSAMMTVSQVGELLNLSPGTVRRLADAKRLPCVRFGAKGDRRFPREEILRTIEKRVKTAG
jgi:excisionase family DNA binding protein